MWVGQDLPQAIDWQHERTAQSGARAFDHTLRLHNLVCPTESRLNSARLTHNSATAMMFPSMAAQCIASFVCSWWWRSRA